MVELVYMFPCYLLECKFVHVERRTRVNSHLNGLINNFHLNRVQIGRFSHGRQAERRGGGWLLRQRRQRQRGDPSPQASARQQHQRVAVPAHGAQRLAS